MIAVIVIPSSKTERGVSVPDWTAPTRTSEDGWRFTPLASPEMLEYARQGVTAQLRGFGPADSFVSEQARIEVDGVSYEVFGAPQHWPSLSGGMAHVEVVLRRVSG